MSPRSAVVLVAVLATLACGGHRAAAAGRSQGSRRVRQPLVDRSTPPVEQVETAWDHVSAALSGLRLGEKATLLQFSSAFCAPCRATRRTLGEVAEIVPGVAHLEVDAELHLELVRRLGILRTPTTLVLDGGGLEVARAAGAPRKEQVLRALGALR